MSPVCPQYPQNPRVPTASPVSCAPVTSTCLQLSSHCPVCILPVSPVGPQCPPSVPHAHSVPSSHRHEAERLAQEARGRLERQRLLDQAEAERARRELLELEALRSAILVLPLPSMHHAHLPTWEGCRGPPFARGSTCSSVPMCPSWSECWGSGSAGIHRPTEVGQSPCL